MERIRLEIVQTDLVCPLCGASVEIGVRERGFYGHCEDRENIPEGACVTSSRRLGNQKTRFHYRFPGFIPRCSNGGCFLHSANKVFRSEEEAKRVWEERTKVW